MTESKKGVSALQIKRTLAVAYKTAWYLCHRIRAAMSQATKADGKLSGTLEADETFIGGKSTGQGRSTGKAHVAGVVERGGRVRLKVVPDRARKALHNFLFDHIDTSKVNKLCTDEWPAYKGLTVNHETVCHAIEEWVRGDVHTT